MQRTVSEVTDSPFPRDPSVTAAYEARADDREAIRAAATEDLWGPDSPVREGHVVPASRAAEVVERFDLGSVEALMFHLIDDAATLADPPISDYWVGIVGRERETGDLVLGGNLEFPETHLGTTVHGEGFVMTRAFHRGTSIDTLALRRAHPCAHCRQYISEFASSGDLTLIDTLGHRLSMADIYPWPFAPSALGQTGAVAGAVNVRSLAARTAPLDLIAAGRRSWAPYSGCPSAVVLELEDGMRFAGSTIESVAFNPTMPPLQSALIELRAAGRHPSEIRRTILGTVIGGAADMTGSTSQLLEVVAPQSVLHIIQWSA